MKFKGASPAQQEAAHLAGVIDITPTWQAVMPVLILALQRGTAAGRKAATDELMRLAGMVDDMNEKPAPVVEELANVGFAPYAPPCAGDGPLTIERDLCWRVTGRRDEVTPQVVGVAAWAFTHCNLTKAQKAAMLTGLGLEWHEEPMGGQCLRPKPEYLGSS